jgi:hypothetical protein
MRLPANRRQYSAHHYLDVAVVVPIVLATTSLSPG